MFYKKNMDPFLNIVLAVLLALQAIASSQAMAQFADAEPPFIDHEITRYGVAEEEQSFRTVVTDNVSVQEVALYYRLSGIEEYTVVPMVLEGDKTYMANLKLAAKPGDVIQYYIVAMDSAGNRSQKGFAFDALERELETKSVVDLEQPQTKTGGGFKWWYIALGVVAVGALAAAAGGGGSGGSGSGAGTFTLNLPSPQ